MIFLNELVNQMAFGVYKSNFYAQIKVIQMRSKTILGAI